MIKHLLFTIICVLGFMVFVSPAKAEDPEDLVIDTECVDYTAQSGLRGNSIPCNEVCKRKCIDAGKNCKYGEPDSCITFLFDLHVNFPEVTKVVKPAHNIFSLELCPDKDTRPEDDPYCTLTIVRLAFYGVISVIMFATVLMGLWVAWVRSTAMDSPEKVEKAVSIGKNAIVGVFIIFFFIAIVQIVSFVLGLTGRLFDFSVVPQPTILNPGDKCYPVNKYVACATGSICYPIDPFESFCVIPP